jgi:FkbM family methyltransferase
MAEHTPCSIHAFDPTIAQLPAGTHPKVNFESLGLGTASIARKTGVDPVHELPKDWSRHMAFAEKPLVAFTDFFPVASLMDLMVRRSHRKIDVLKIDVEGAEYEIFEAWCSGRESMPLFDMLLLEVQCALAEQR